MSEGEEEREHDASVTNGQAVCAHSQRTGMGRGRDQQDWSGTSSKFIYSVSVCQHTHIKPFRKGSSVLLGMTQMP